MFEALKILLSVSRVRFWLYLGGTFIVGYTAGAYSGFQFQKLSMYWWWLYFLTLANLFLYGVNDLEDEDTDAHNSKKGSQEHLLREEQKWVVGSGVLVAALVGLVSALLSGNVLVLWWVCLFLLLGWGYSARPLRLKARPVWDFVSNILYLMPGLVGYALAVKMSPAWWVVLSGAMWVGAMHVYSAVPDIVADAKAGVRTTAVWLGRTGALWLCVALWTGACVVMWLYGEVLGWWRLGAWIYPLLGLASLMSGQERRLYWWLPVVNGVMGVWLFWGLYGRILW